MTKPRLLDVCCCQGGAAYGYHLAGFDPTGLDIAPQPRFPFPFIQGDALEYIAKHGHEYDVIHASPPCQAYSLTQRIQRNEHPDLIGPIREALEATGKPWVIENVPAAAPWLRNPIELCGAAFGLRTYRHRLFESNIPLVAPSHPKHSAQQVKMGRPVKAGDFYQAVGNFSGVAYARADMGVPWMTRDGIRESIPPVYAQHVGMQLLASLPAERAA
jgi:DNA (cytosine-5)-methyltransferase 1